MPISFVVLLQIFFVIIVTIHGEDTFDCTGYEDDSYHPIYDADDCRHYWHCIYVNTVYMHAVKRVCPAGTEFHSTLRQCETSSLVDCVPARSPHMPRTSSTTKAWKWKYSKLFSRLNWTPTMPYLVTTKRHQIFDLGDLSEIDTTTMIMPEAETTEQIQVLPFTLSQPTTVFSLEQLSKNLHAMILNRRPPKYKPVAGKFFQPGEPDNEAEVYTSTIQSRIRRTRYTTSIQTTAQLPLTTLLFTTETATTTTTIAPMTTIISTTITTTTNLSPLTSIPMTTVITQSDPIININLQSRIGGQRRRDNMTLYILTSDEHKIRQFSVNHTRGILINCNQLRRRLLGRRRRLRDTLQTTSTTINNFIIAKNSSIQTFQYNILLLTILSFFFFTKIIIIT